MNKSHLRSLLASMLFAAAAAGCASELDKHAAARLIRAAGLPDLT